LFHVLVCFGKGTKEREIKNEELRMKNEERVLNCQLSPD